ncbi:hypothetical protein K435DRAFT_798398 [Dendrothele bispora CBS 962.96]|uniref:Uncharacterized protein n=1 Tax=Dendrothele bispora (strain CBS 962.96) TaxID=1314807 RepID=A0A4S8M014_DENBC|nr:hypothetical protein K435DRAFT_798398 [Dendrothele bispora CBS 962.96]
MIDVAADVDDLLDLQRGGGADGRSGGSSHEDEVEDGARTGDGKWNRTGLSDREVGWIEGMSNKQTCQYIVMDPSKIGKDFFGNLTCQIRSRYLLSRGTYTRRAYEVDHFGAVARHERRNPSSYDHRVVESRLKKERRRVNVLLSKRMIDFQTKHI